MFKQSKNRRKSSSANRVKPVEALECRRMLTVTTSQAGGDLLISGDGSNNHIAIFESNGFLFIYGDTATGVIAGDGTVAGAVTGTAAGRAFVSGSGQFENIQISLGSGNDTVEVSSLLASDVDTLSINTGDAVTGDTVMIGNSNFTGFGNSAVAVAGGVTITTGNGADTVNVNFLTTGSAGAEPGDLDINTGLGGDFVGVALDGAVTTHGDANFDSGLSGTDTISVGNTNSADTVDGTMSVTTGSGNDNVLLDDLSVGFGSEAGDLRISSNQGNDFIALASVAPVGVDGAITINTDGSTVGDTIHLGSATHSVSSAADIFLRSSSGDDTISVDNTTANNLTIQSNAGNDTISVGTLAADTFVDDASIDSGSANFAGADTVHVGSTGFAVSVGGSLAVTGGGNDVVTLDNLTAASLSVNAGDGTNSVQAGSSAAVSVTGSFSVTTGAGADSVAVDRATIGSLSVSTGGGADVIAVGSVGTVTSTGGASLDAGDSATLDTVNIGNAFGVSFAGDVLVRTGSGNDIVNVNQLGANDLTIQTGAGADTIKFDSTAASKIAAALLIDAGDALTGDIVHVGSLIAPVSVGTSLTLLTGSGADIVTLDHVTAAKTITINTLAGVDAITVGAISPVIASGLSINSGDANDTISVNSLTGNGLGIEAGNGNDHVTLNKISLVSTMTVSLSAGINTLSATNVKAQNGTILGGNGIDTVTLSTANINTLSVDTGAGADVVTFNASSVFGSLTVNTGLQNDKVYLTKVTVGIATIDAGDGDDLLNISSGSVITHLFAVMNTGNDTLTASSSTFSDTSLLDGGAGTDHATFTSVTKKKTVVTSF